MIRLTINGSIVEVPESMTIAAAILSTGTSALRTSVTGEPRGALCGMGVCFECRVTVDGRPHVKSCQTICRSGMQVATDAG